ncbi:hypothetical protein LC607_26400 [Nostoc sp. CHAB 5824]|nr:hypothetical protein [Nostoc sp. CHAB 5824]
MTVNQATVHPSTVLIPAPKYKLGQRVEWNKADNDAVLTNQSFTGIITEQTFRTDYEISKWQYTIAITTARVNGSLVDWYADDSCFDLDECFLSACHSQND